MCSVKSRSNRSTSSVDVIFGTLCMWPAPRRRLHFVPHPCPTEREIPVLSGVEPVMNMSSEVVCEQAFLPNRPCNLGSPKWSRPA